MSSGLESPSERLALADVFRRQKQIKTTRWPASDKAMELHLQGRLWIIPVFYQDYSSPMQQGGGEDGCITRCVMNNVG